jgi:hypothetical protein
MLDAETTPEPTEAEVADGWLKDDDFYNWLLAHKFDPGMLHPHAVLFLATGVYSPAVTKQQHETAKVVTEAQQLADALASWVALVADPVRRMGEDSASLRSVVAWHRQQQPNIVFEVQDEALAAALEEAAETWQDELDEYAAQCRAVKEANRDPLREARGDPPVPVPPTPLEPNPDDVARWLVAHAGRYTLELGIWWVNDQRADDGTVVGRYLTYQEIGGWVPYQRRCAAWAVWMRLMTAAEASPDGEALRAHAVKALLDWKHLPPALYEQVRDEYSGATWTFKAPRPPEPEVRRTETSRQEPQRARRAATLSDGELRAAILQAVRMLKTRHRQWPSKNAIRENVTGSHERIITAIDALVMEGDLMPPDEEHSGYWLDE